jgi:predicted MPP superfamily phosphohydrolase
MGKSGGAAELLRRAQAVFDDPSNRLASAAAGAWRGGFASGGQWMAAALEVLRGCLLPPPPRNLHYLGLVKYGLAGGAALLCVAAGLLLRTPLVAALCVPVFYAVEAQMVFLFPLVLDGEPWPFRESLRWTRRAGGTLRVMGIVMPIAATMVFGGFLGRGFVRSWCTGCLAVCIWYEDLRGAARLEPRSHFPFEFGSFRPLHVRREAVALGTPQPVRILYASDLHLGHWWTAPVGELLYAAAREAKPHLILLGGDLIDHRRALPDLHKTIGLLTSVAPVHAISGNHDDCLDPGELRAAILAAGGHWLPEQPIDAPIRIDGTLRAGAGPRILCAHYPSVFPDAVAAGYTLVLAGHLHGGQCVLGTQRDRLYPACWIHRWHGLRFTDQGALLLVSRGAGDTFPFRFNCPREVILCEIT